MFTTEEMEVTRKRRKGKKGGPTCLGSQSCLDYDYAQLTILIVLESKTILKNFMKYTLSISAEVNRKYDTPSRNVWSERDINLNSGSGWWGLLMSFLVCSLLSSGTFGVNISVES